MPAGQHPERTKYYLIGGLATKRFAKCKIHLSDANLMAA
jgi:hypothetical protein